jgi:hypothetical protein
VGQSAEPQPQFDWRAESVRGRLREVAALLEAIKNASEVSFLNPAPEVHSRTELSHCTPPHHTCAQHKHLACTLAVPTRVLCVCSPSKHANVSLTSLKISAPRSTS